MDIFVAAIPENNEVLGEDDVNVPFTGQDQPNDTTNVKMNEIGEFL